MLATAIHRLQTIEWPRYPSSSDIKDEDVI